MPTTYRYQGTVLEYRTKFSNQNKWFEVLKMIALLVAHEWDPLFMVKNLILDQFLFDEKLRRRVSQ